MARLRELAERHPVIGDVRGMGLMVAIELVRDRATKEPAPDVLGRVQNEAKRRGLIIGRGGLHANVIRICPPLIVSERDVDDAIRILDEAFAVATSPCADAITPAVRRCRCARGSIVRSFTVAGSLDPATLDATHHPTPSSSQLPTAR